MLRNLKDLTADYPHIAAAAGTVTSESALLDGEIVALDRKGIPSFQVLQHRTATRSAIVFYAFDLLHLGTEDYRTRPLRDRRRVLAALKFGAPILLLGYRVRAAARGALRGQPPGIGLHCGVYRG